MTKQRKKPEGDVEKYDAVIEAPEAAKATGTESVELCSQLLNQVWYSLWRPAGMSKEKQNEAIKAALAALQGIAPKMK